MAMRDRERGTVFWSFGYPENIDQTHQIQHSTNIQELYRVRVRLDPRKN